MSVTHRGRMGWALTAVSAACAASLFLTGAASGDDTTARDSGTRAVAASAPVGPAAPGTGVASTPSTGAASAPPGGAAPGDGTATPVPGSEPPGPGAPYAGRSRVFGLVEAGPSPQFVRFALARKAQPAGPETVHPVDVGRYVTLRLAPGAVIRASAPIANEGVTDWVRGIRLTPEQFWVLMRRLQARSHPLRERSHMFELWFDGRGRITRMQHYFSP